MDILHTDQTVTIAAGGTVSSEADLRNYELVGIITDADFVTANLTLKDSVVQGGTKLNAMAFSTATSAFANITLDGLVASKSYKLLPDVVKGLLYVNFTSSAAQTSGTTIRLITKERA